MYSTLSADGRTVESFDGPGVPYAHKFTSVRSATGEAPRGIATLGGVVATDLIRWDHYFQRACVARRDGDDPKVPGSIPTAATPCGLCHDLGDVTTVCSGRIREALGQVKVGKAVRRGRARAEGSGVHESASDRRPVRATLFEWYKANVAHAKTPEWSVTGAAAARFRAKDDDGRAAATRPLLGRKNGDPSETLSKETLSEETLGGNPGETRTRDRADSNPVPSEVRRVPEPLALHGESTSRLCWRIARKARFIFAQEGPKEVTEAYGTYERVRDGSRDSTRRSARSLRRPKRS